MATLNQRIERLERLVNELLFKIDKISKDTIQKENKPYSKVSPLDKLGNLDGIWVKGTWRNFAIYKDEPGE